MMIAWDAIFSFHHTKGSKLVERSPGALRLYNMAFCPYGHRVLLIAAAKGINLDIINVDLTNPPEWMSQRGFTGVPVLESDTGYIKESLDICTAMDRMAPKNPMLPGDEEGRRLARNLAAQFQNVVTHIFPLFFKIFDDKDATPELEKLTNQLLHFERHLEQGGENMTFFAGKEPGYVDYAIWPFVERLGIMKHLFPTAYDYAEAKKRLPLWEGWRERMELDPCVKTCLLSTKDHLKYIQNRRDLSRGLVAGMDYTYVLH